jgi:ABC-type proline/glycine betaine transport system permease subunit
MAVTQTLLSASALTASSPAAIVTRVNRQTTLQPQIRKVFEIIQALPSLNIFESVAELDRYLAAMQRKVREGEAG